MDFIGIDPPRPSFSYKLFWFLFIVACFGSAVASLAYLKLNFLDIQYNIIFFPSLVVAIFIVHFLIWKSNPTYQALSKWQSFKSGDYYMPVAGPIATLVVTPIFGFMLLYGPMMIIESKWLPGAVVVALFNPVIETHQTSRGESYLVRLDTQSWKFALVNRADLEKLGRPLTGTIKTGIFGNSYLLRLE